MASVFSSGALLLVVKLLGIAVTFCTTVILARLLGAAEYGEYAFFLALVSVASIPSQFGLPVLIVREASKLFPLGQLAEIRALRRWALHFVVLSSLFVIAALFAGAQFFPESIGRNPSVLVLSVALIPILALSNLINAELRGVGWTILGHLPEYLLRPFLFFLGIGISLSWASLTVRGVFAVQISAFLVVLVLSYLALLRSPVGIYRIKLKSARNSENDVKREKRQYWLKSSFLLGSVAGLVLINNTADIIMLGVWSVNEEIGRYRLASMVAAVVTLGFMVMNSYAMPEISRYAALGKFDKLQRVVMQSSQVSFGFGLVVLLLVFLAMRMDPIRLFGEDFRGAAEIFYILGFGYIVNSFFGPVGAVLSMQGAERILAIATAVGTAFNIMLNAVLIPEYHGVGAAFASSVTVTITKFVIFVIAWRRFGIVCCPINVKWKHK